MTCQRCICSRQHTADANIDRVVHVGPVNLEAGHLHAESLRFEPMNGCYLGSRLSGMHWPAFARNFTLPELTLLLHRSFTSPHHRRHNLAWPSRVQNSRARLELTSWLLSVVQA